MEFRGEKVWVLPVKGRAADVAELRRTLAAMGATIICPDKDELKDWDDCLAEATVVVVPLCAESLGDQDIETIVVAASRAGKRIVGIWLDDIDAEIPPWLGREGNAVVVSTPERIREAVIEEKEIWESPKGKQRPKQPTPRHKGH